MAATRADLAAEPLVTAFSPLRTPIFRAVWLASAFSNLGGLIQSVGASWLMLSLAQSAEMVALVQASTALPVVLLSLLAGAVADNMDRRKVMLLAQWFMLLVSIGLALCAWLGWITPWLLLSFTFLLGCGAAFNAPAWQASVGDMVPRAQLASAVALNSLGFNIARSVGPAIGGGIVAVAGAFAAFVANALSYIGLIVVLSRWRAPIHPQVLPRETLRLAVTAGLRYVAMSPAIRTVLLRSTVFGLGASAVMALMPLMAKQLIAGGPLTFGLLFGAFGVGAVAGAIVSARLRRRLSTEVLVRSACLGFAMATLLAASSTELLLTMLALCIAGAGWVLALSTFNVTVQLSAPRWVVARALSIYQMAAFGGIAAGSWTWGVLAVQADVHVALLAAAVVMLLSALLGRWLPLRQLTDLNLEPLRPWSQPSTAVPVEPRTGPVVVTIEYTIAEADILQFLAAMADRRRIRFRDGARNWHLLRDLADPQLWIERYETPTWLDYLRHISRMTQDDALIPERIRALHQGAEPPKVRRLLERQTSSLPNIVGTPGELAEPSTDVTRTS
jgi:MFS family permease